MWPLVEPATGGDARPCAGDLTVTTTADSGPGSLRQALTLAESGDTITFDLPNPSVITLSSELVIATDLTIQGPGVAALTISGNNATRVFFINPGAAGATSGPPATALTVTIADLTIANGKAKGSDGGYASAAGGGAGGGAAGMGGAIFVNHSDLTLSGVSLRGNQAQGGNGSGGPSTQTSGSGYGGGGLGAPNAHGATYGVDGGAFGGIGGAVATLNSNALAGGEGAGVVAALAQRVKAPLAVRAALAAAVAVARVRPRSTPAATAVRAVLAGRRWWRPGRDEQ